MLELSELLRCPNHGLPLQREAATWVCSGGDSFPIVDGISILLPGETERRKLAGTDWSSETVGTTPLDFYNQPRDQEKYCRDALPAERGMVERWAVERRSEGCSLEIGSGRGALQGIGGEYVALDYGFTALRKYVSAEYARVCGTAEALPFADGAFSLIFTVAALEHVPAADRAIAEIDRVLKPGGVAVLAPAWHCGTDNCYGIPVRPYHDLSLSQKWAKLTYPLRSQRSWKAVMMLPGRIARRTMWRLSGKPTTTFHFGRLPADYDNFWLSDSDACSRLDSHEACLFFASRGYEILSPGSSARRQLLCGHQPVVVRKSL